MPERATVLVIKGVDDLALKWKSAEQERAMTTMMSENCAENHRFTVTTSEYWDAMVNLALIRHSTRPRLGLLEDRLKVLISPYLVSTSAVSADSDYRA
jgi:hypothetical protein